MIKNLRKVIDEYKKGTNLIKYIGKNFKNKISKNEIIQYSYDIQAGSYTSKAKKNPDDEIRRGKAFAHEITKLGEFDTILEAGVGEATSMAAMLNELTYKPKKVKGFDISFSRILYAKEFIKNKFSTEIDFAVADILHCPIEDNAIDLVYTIHALEPNGGNELKLLKELIRITKNYVVLFEPLYELGSKESKLHMDNHNYVKNLAGIAKSLGHEVLENKIIFDSNLKTKNNTGVIVIKKVHKDAYKKGANNPAWACPIAQKNLKLESNFLFSQDSMMVYPKIKDIPILLKKNSILASHLNNF